jgi:multimeric flavodoxin WrbA
MKKIFAYVGSQAGKSSKTAAFINAILDNLAQKAPGEIECEVYTAKDVEVLRCRSCNRCFVTGQCVLDKQDDMLMLKKKMLDSDFIIWSSPVYAHSISGDMKTFIDRISYWMHIMPLAGKTGVVLSSSYNNGNIYVNQYLYKIMSYIGIKVIGNFTATMVCEADVMENEINKFTQNIYEYVICGKKVESDKILDGIFKTMKKNAMQQEQYKTSEYLYWRDNGYFQCENFGEVLEKVSNKQENFSGSNIL